MTTMTESPRRSRRPSVSKNTPTNRLREKLLARRLTLAEVSRRSQINAQTIHRYETGERAVSVERMEVLAKAMGLNLPDVLPDNGPTDAPAVVIPRHYAVPASMLQPGSIDELEAAVTDRATELALAIADVAGPQARGARARLIREALSFAAAVRRRVLESPDKS